MIGCKGKKKFVPQKKTNAPNAARQFLSFVITQTLNLVDVGKNSI